MVFKTNVNELSFHTYILEPDDNALLRRALNINLAEFNMHIPLD